MAESAVQERHSCSTENAVKFQEWFKSRGGILIWPSIDFGSLGTSWTTPYRNADGTQATKPTWKAANEPSRHITDPAEVDVITEQEVKRFHVATRMGGNGLSIKVTGGGTRRIHKEVEKAQEKYGKPAWYAFDYGDYKNCVILVEGDRQPLPEWLAAHGQSPTDAQASSNLEV